MTPFPITTLYAGILGLLLIVLALRVIVVVRFKGETSLGDAGNPAFNTVIRGHGNFIEFVPMAVVLMGLAEAAGSPDALLHGLGAALVVARIAHPIGLSPNPKPAIRVFGAVTTFLVIIITAALCLYASVARFV